MTERIAVWCRAGRPLIAAAMLVLAALLSAAGPAMAQPVPCVPPDPPNSCTISNTESNHVTDVFVPNATVVAPNQPVLSSLLVQALNGPHGAAILSALNRFGVLGPETAATVIGTRFDGTTINITTQVAFGPATLLIGDDQSEPFFVAFGTTNLNTHTHLAHFFSRLFQASRALSLRGVNFLLGDLHTTFQTTLLDDGFHFTDGLLSRGRGAGIGDGFFAAAPLAFAPGTTVSPPIDQALAYAARSPATAAMGHGWNAWVRGAVSQATFHGTAANFGFSTRSVGGEVGIEKRNAAWLYGAAIALGNARISQDVTDDRGAIDTFRFGAYASYQPGAWNLTGAVAVGLHSLSAVRLAAFPVPASSSYDATSLGAGLEINTRYPLLGATIEPLAGFAYTHLHANGFTETGTTFLTLASSGADIAALKSYAGARVWWTHMFATGPQIVSELRGRVLYDFLNDPRGYTARFTADPAGTAIPVTGLSPERLGVMLGTGLGLRFSPTWRAIFNYDAELRGSDVAHLFSAGLKGNW